MDIAGLSIALSQSQVKQQASLSVMKSAMDVEASNADGLIDMLNSASGQAAQHPHLGGTIDLKG